MPSREENAVSARIVSATTTALGSFTAIVAAVVISVAWAVSGPLFHFSDGWQLTINTLTNEYATEHNVQNEPIA